MVVLGLHTGELGNADLQVFLDSFQVSFPILLETNPSYNQYRQIGAISPFPLDYVIDRAGRVAYFGTEYDPEAMTMVVDSLLADPSSVEDLPPVSNRLHLEAWPNPFNPRTRIRFRLPRSGAVDLDIHDARGRLVRRLVTGRVYAEGPGSVDWDGTDDRGRALATGLYLVRVRSGGSAEIAKVTLLR